MKLAGLMTIQEYESQAETVTTDIRDIELHQETFVAGKGHGLYNHEHTIDEGWT